MGMGGIFMNTRRPALADRRVRQALIEAFNWQFINNTLSGGKDQRITSYFANSDLGMKPGAPAEGRELALLEPFAADLPGQPAALGAAARRRIERWCEVRGPMASSLAPRSGLAPIKLMWSVISIKSPTEKSRLTPPAALVKSRARQPSAFSTRTGSAMADISCPS